ncbi:uncharacterized protein LOC126379024 isoform X2 [Pectinophora gossypiella]|uniref:uncharacterized protein LOC126379024 isoform X2 n=1 Tax=Pectinophora gossypiella TaxID=13191 RepID=UPI00214F2D9F|nr:uncharacterized protein LOC126379024 isoform X2 [Pectinophora gossypiella]
MLKLTAVVSLMLIGSTLWAAGLSCDSCGSECASACGTRHFRSCCFNYLRRKRTPELGMKLFPQQLREVKESPQKARLVVFENIPEPWLSNLVPDYKPRPMEDPTDRLQALYDA